MIDDIALAGLSAAAYTAAPTWWQGDVHACLTETPGASVIAFRGTVMTDAEAWLQDLDAVPVWRNGIGYCHRGFIEDAEAIWPGIKLAVRSRPFILTGHSLGGALAVCTAALMARMGVLPVLVVTFGAPRVGELELRELLAAVPIRQYQHGNDPVPDMPPFFMHARVPLLHIGAAAEDPIDCHAIGGYQAALAASP